MPRASKIQCYVTHPMRSSVCCHNFYHFSQLLNTIQKYLCIFSKFNIFHKGQMASYLIKTQEKRKKKQKRIKENKRKTWKSHQICALCANLMPNLLPVRQEVTFTWCFLTLEPFISISSHVCLLLLLKAWECVSLDCLSSTKTLFSMMPSLPTLSPGCDFISSHLLST